MKKDQLDELNRVRDNSMIELNLKRSTIDEYKEYLQDKHNFDLLERSTPTPILVLYLDVREVDSNNLTETLDSIQSKMEKYTKYGWLYMVLPIYNDSRLEVAAIDKTFNGEEFEKFKTEILEKLNVINRTKTSL